MLSQTFRLKGSTRHLINSTPFDSPCNHRLLCHPVLPALLLIHLQRQLHSGYTMYTHHAILTNFHQNQLSWNSVHLPQHTAHIQSLCNLLKLHCSNLQSLTRMRFVQQFIFLCPWCPQWMQFPLEVFSVPPDFLLLLWTLVGLINFLLTCIALPCDCGSNKFLFYQLDYPAHPHCCLHNSPITSSRCYRWHQS